MRSYFGYEAAIKKRRSLWFNTIVMVFCLVCICARQSAQAQEFKPLQLSVIHGYLEMSYEFDDETRTRQQSGTSFDTEEMELHERLQLNVDGYFFHPTIAKFSVGAKFDLLQKHISLLGEKGRYDQGLLLGGDFRLAFLDDHYYTFSVSGSRQETDVDPLFQRSYVLSRDTLGATFGFRKGPIPFDISYTHGAVRGSGSAVDVKETSDELSLRGRYQFGERTKGDLEYHFSDTRQEAFNRTITMHRFSASNVTELDEEGRKRLRGDLRFRRQSGSLKSSRFSVRESLNWRHADNLSTFYSLDFNRTETNDEKVDIWNGTASLSHDLYGGLRSLIDLHAGLDESSSGKTIKYQGSISESYSRRLGSKGRLNLGARGFGDFLDRRPEQGTANIQNESITFNGMLPVALSQFDVIPSSIEVTDDRGLIVYEPLLDYTIVEQGPALLIARSLFGDIPAGATVLVSYQYRLDTASSVLSRGFDTNLRLSFDDSLSVYGRYTQNRQELLSGSRDARLDNLNRWLIGGKVDWSWISAGIELEDRDSTISPLRSFSRWITFSSSPSRRVKGQLSLTARHINYTDSDEAIDMLDVFAGVSSEITRRARIEVDANYRRQEGTTNSILNDLDAYDLKGAFVWRYRQLSLQAGVHFSVIEQSGQNEQVTEFNVALRRSF